MFDQTEENSTPTHLIPPGEITPDVLAEIGMQTHVYARPVQAKEILEELQGQLPEGMDVPPETWLYSVHAANGVRVAIVDSREAAFQGAAAYGYQALSVH